MTSKTLLLASVASVFVATAAWGVPSQLAHQGRLLDTEGAALTGEHDLTFALFDAATDGAEVWSETITVDIVGGFYSVVLGADEDANPLDDLVLGNPPLWLELTVDDGEPLLPRHELLSVPYAVIAGTATNLEGGYVDASEVAVDGSTVIDASGNWVGPTPAVDWTDLSGVPTGLGDGVDADTLGALLSCADGGVAKFDLGSGLWACGTDSVLGSSEVLGFVGGAMLDFGVGSTVNGVTVATVADLDWSLLSSVPVGFQDGDDADSLAALGPTCAEGDRAAWSTTLGSWACTAEQVGLDRLDTATASGGQVMTFNGANVAWEDPATTTNPPCTLSVLDETLAAALVNCGATSMALRTWLRPTQISAGSSHTCGIDGGGSVLCWGSDSNGQSTPPGGSFTQVSTGFSHTCGIDGGGSVQCWGSDSTGQSTPPGGTFTQISAGSSHTCGIDSSGLVLCWGEDSYGQSTPPGGTFTQISAGVFHTCGIDSSLLVQCWGRNEYGESTPPGGTFSQVSVGRYYTCGIDSGGTIQCWGRDNYGQSTPPGGTFTQISTSVDNHTCGIDGSGSVQCWGLDNYGQSTPPSGTFTQVSAGAAHTCGVLQPIGTVVCWGNDLNGMSSPP